MAIDGYVYAEHDDGTRTRQHVKVAERALGKRLPANAVVHHVDGDGRNNANRNLVICQDQAYHWLLHCRQDVIQHGGNPNTDYLCRDCGRPKPFCEFHHRSTGRPLSYCKACAMVRRIATRERQRKEGRCVTCGEPAQLYRCRSCMNARNAYKRRSRLAQ